jgi:uncharacterized protein with PIN domain
MAPLFNPICLNASTFMSVENVDSESAGTPMTVKFYCDEMLQRLGRWLRAAGYDTRIQINGGSDSTMLRDARREARLLLTRDHKLMEFRNAADTVLLLHGNTLQECIDELTSRLQLNWLYRPFSRCLMCNTVLVEADTEAWNQLPKDSRLQVQKLLSCSCCARIYWEGGHVRRMRARLVSWQGGAHAYQ